MVVDVVVPVVVVVVPVAVPAVVPRSLSSPTDTRVSSSLTERRITC